MTPTTRKCLEEAAARLRQALKKRQERRAELEALLRQLDAFLQSVEDDPYAP